MYSAFLEIWPKCHHRWPNYWVMLRICSRLNQNGFQKIMRKWKKVFYKKIIFRIFLLKIIWNVCTNKFIKIGAKTKYEECSYTGNISESGSQGAEDAVVKVSNSLRILSKKSTISQRLNIAKTFLEHFWWDGGGSACH